ncbi:META domain-containing protein [Microcella sp.]|uniref:META domain-containing protein n=1 Tax=Microcella sp. TaxID=1913979 RepID=UPI00299F6B8D|nr:META domain-containing protein [Microcella sp.]MDX2026532.1 META domain-containing protein [Microcella sp.]
MRNRPRPTLVMIGMLAASIPLLSACAGLMSGTTALQGEWVLASGSDTQGAFIDSAQPVTLTFDGDSVSGQAPCNAYSGSVARGPGAGSTGPLEIGGITRTEMGCAEQEQNELEGRYFAALEAADSVNVSADGEILELTGDGVFVRFERSESREG